MYKKKKDKRKKSITIGVGAVIAIVLLVISVAFINRDEYVIKDTAMFIEKIIMYPFTVLNNGKKEKATESYLIQKNVNASLEKEISELKDMLELNKTLTEYTPINATVLSRNKSYWFNTITIDKGRSSGIKKDMAVITKNGLIGKISRVSNNSSEVKLVTSDDINFKVSVSIRTADRDNYAILNGYDKENNLIKVTGIDKTTPVNKDDVVLTSGLGEMFPAGIYIGTVEKSESDKYNLSQTLYVKTYQDFNNLHYVTVLKVK
ncbi:MAG: rod shape-determining protein MreC [Bacilli bacterium]|nr:rod shape-determining protein MreC [Bacilli bacterium]